MHLARRLLAASCTLLIAGTATAHWAAPTSATGAKRPNIVVIVADDWGFTDLGAFGG